MAEQSLFLLRLSTHEKALLEAEAQRQRRTQTDLLREFVRSLQGNGADRNE